MIEDIIYGMTPGRALLWLIAVLFLAALIRKVEVSAEIARLGTRAPQVRFWAPYGIDFITKSGNAKKNFRDLDHYNHAMQTAHGMSKIPNPKTAELNAGISNRIIMTSDPENIKALLTGQFADYGKGESFHQEWHEFLGDSIFVTDGELWSRSRQLIRPMFTRNRIVDTEIFEKHVQHLIPFLTGNSSGGRVVDVGPLFFRYTLDAATDYLLGRSAGSLSDPKTTFAEAFRYVQARQAEYFRTGCFSWLLTRTEFRKQLRVMDDFIQPYIDHVLSLSADELDQKLSNKETFLDALARFTRDPRVLRDQLVAVLLAGRDTTAGTLSLCLFELSRNPHIVARLRDEIRTRVGVGPSGKKPSYTNLKEMKFLNAVLNETMRFYPVVPFNVRHSLHNTTLPRGGGPDGLSPIGVRENTRVVYSAIFMHRDPRHYDPPGSPNYFDPGKWLPERWVSGWQPRPWHFIPFNGGPRICIGQQFALIEMGYTIVRILQAFKQVVAVPETGKEKVQDPLLEFDITLSTVSELNCVFVRDGGE